MELIDNAQNVTDRYLCIEEIGQQDNHLLYNFWEDTINIMVPKELTIIIIHLCVYKMIIIIQNPRSQCAEIHSVARSINLNK